jgi:membrane dipeptidase
MRNWIVDAHLDLGWNALQWQRDLTASVMTLRTQEAGMSGKGRAQNTVALPEMRRGNVAMCFATLMGRSTGTPNPIVDFHSQTQTYAVARGHLAYYRALEYAGEAKIVTDLTGLDAHVAALDAAYENGGRLDTGKIGFVISMESADAIQHPDQLGDWVQAGVRLIGPTHYGMGRYAGGTAVEAGFTPQGFALLNQMEAHKVILDVTHLSDRAFNEALDRFGGHIIASHSNCRALVGHQRQLSDRQILALAARGAVIGMAFDVWMLEFGWIKGTSSNTGIGLARIADHIDHICQLTGKPFHVGIGSDLDGGYGREQSPYDLDTIEDLQKLYPLLQSRGYSDNDVESIFHANWIRKLREAWQ